MSTLAELTYTPHNDIQTSNDNPSTMVLMVHTDTFHQYEKDKSIPLAQVVDSFDIFKYQHGRSGKLAKPSQRELEDTFGTTKEDVIVQIMLEKGKLHGTHTEKTHSRRGDRTNDHVRK